MPKECREEFSPTFTSIDSKVSNECQRNGERWREGGVNFGQFPNFPPVKGGGPIERLEK